MAKKIEEHPLIVAQGGVLKGSRWALDHPVVIGREATCEVVIQDRQVSRFHARLTPTPEGIILDDLDSKNGTHYNGSPVSAPVVLQDGDIIQIALSQEFLFLTSDATIPLVESGLMPGRLRLDLRSRLVWVNQRQVLPPLSALQFRILNVLYEEQGAVVSREELISQVWGDEQSAGVTDQAVDAIVRRLRDRLAAMDPTHNYIVTVRGHGLKLDNPPVE